MSVQRLFNRCGISIEEAHNNKAARERQTITRTKPPRPHDSYRGSKTSRAGYRGKWGIPNELTLQGKVLEYSIGRLNLRNVMDPSAIRALGSIVRAPFKGLRRKP